MIQQIIQIHQKQTTTKTKPKKYKPLTIMYLYFDFQREGRHYRDLGRGKT